MLPAKLGQSLQPLKSDPHMYLNNFGENELLESSFVDAE